MQFTHPPSKVLHPRIENSPVQESSLGFDLAPRRVLFVQSLRALLRCDHLPNCLLPSPTPRWILHSQGTRGRSWRWWRRRNSNLSRSGPAHAREFWTWTRNRHGETSCFLNYVTRDLGQSDLRLCAGHHLHLVQGHRDRSVLAFTHALFCHLGRLHPQQDCQKNEQV